ncbi:uncharacterized protein LOC122537972 [Frieseomelitta varia]|uniref:uncharacterized protein LOC122537972 n=1 Tax=Frieseomelitta varia TaxID=561572 RepID=UPI001CB69415|nr:uncharacterized protein LOC122537972 [Frieseomelitta varia]
MGKLTCNIVASDTSVDGVKIVHEKQKVRTKRKKRKRDLTDQKIFKLKKDKKTKINEKLDEAQNSKKISNRILPQPLAGIYRNGATGKEIRRAQTEVALNDLNNARLHGNVLKLLDGYHSKSEDAATKNSNRKLKDFSLENILKPDAETSPILGKIDGRKDTQKKEDIEIPQRSIEENRIDDSEQNSALNKLNKYEELCRIVSSENFEENNFPDCFGPDPLLKVKQKLRYMYAESFRNKLIHDTIMRGNILSNYSTPSTSTDNFLPSNAAFCPSGSNQNVDSIFATVDNLDHCVGIKKDIENKNTPFLIPETNFKRNEITSSNLLFNLSSLNASDMGIENSLEAETLQKTSNISNEDDSINLSNHTSLEVNPPSTSISANSNIVKYFETNEFERIKEKSKPVLFVQTEAESENNYNHKKYRSRRTQTVGVLSNGLENNAEKQNLKILQQIKMKNLKHIPIILRRCNNIVTNNNNQLNLFQESMHINKEPQEMLFNAASRQNVLFTSQSLITESNENSQRLQRSTTVNTLFDTTDIENLQTCVIESPSLRNDDIYFVKNSSQQNQSQSQNLHVNGILVNKKNPSVQKTVVFTKKDSRNVGHCLYLNNEITDEMADNSNICIIRKNVSSQHEKLKNNCTTHKNCQEVPENYKTYQCSQSFDNSNYSNQEFKEISISQHQKSQICEMLAKRVQQHPKCENNKTCYNDQHVCYVMANQCKDSNNVQECSHDIVHQIEKSRKLQNSNQEFNQEDINNIDFLKGIKNLKILPIKKRFQNQCNENAVIVNEQPIKYLAFENDSKAQKVPIYLQSSKHVASADNIKVIDPNVNCHMVSCPQESTQKIIFVPTCEQNEVVYIKQQNLPHSNIAFEKCSHPRKLVLYRPEVKCVEDSSNICEVHVPKQNVMEIRKIDNDTIITNLQQTDNVKKSTQSGTNWEELHCRSNHEHDTCTRNQAIFYQK